MFGNIVILLISVFVIWLNIYVLTYKKNTSLTAKLISILLFVIWILSVVSPNIPVLKSPFTSAMKGRVVDAETKKPLPNINVKIGWKTAYATAGGGSPAIYKALPITTDEKGEFSIPTALKQLSIYIWPFFSREYGGIRIIAYSYDYEFARKDISADAETKLVEIPMRLISDDKSYLENILNIYWKGLAILGSDIGDHYKNVTPDEKKFLINAYHSFDKKYPNSNYAELKKQEYLGQLATTFNKLDPLLAVEINQKIIEKYPSDFSARYAKEEIERLKKRYNLKINK